MHLPHLPTHLRHSFHGVPLGCQLQLGQGTHQVLQCIGGLCMSRAEQLAGVKWLLATWGTCAEVN